VWWVGQDIAQFGTPEGLAKCIAASAYNYAAVIVGIVEKLDQGIRGGICIPMNFANNGFFFDYNENLNHMITTQMRTRIDQALADFRARPNSLDWGAVDYSRL
jgi:basic membrane protein A